MLFDSNSNFKTMSVRFGENVILGCPFKNMDHFEWHQNTKPMDNKQMLHVELRNVSFKDAGKGSI